MSTNNGHGRRMATLLDNRRANPGVGEPKSSAATSDAAPTAGTPGSDPEPTKHGRESVPQTPPLPSTSQWHK